MALYQCIAVLFQTFLEWLNRKTDKSSNQQLSKRRIEWNDTHQVVTEKLIDVITSFKIMAYPDFSEPFILHTDASYDGLGSVLYQKLNGEMCVIGYASRTLRPAEINCHSTKLELLALKWSVTSAIICIMLRVIQSSQIIIQLLIC